MGCFSRHGGLVGRLEAIATFHAAGATWRAFGAHLPNHTSEKGGLRAQRGTKHVTTAHKRRVKKTVSPPEPPKPVSPWLCPRRTFCVVCVCVVVCQIVLNKKKKRARVTENSLAS